METKLQQEINKVLKSFPEYWDEDKLLKNKVIEDIRSYNEAIIGALLSNELIKDTYSLQFSSGSVFKIEDFISMLRFKNYWNNSYTKYTNEIGLTSEDKYFRYNTDVVLDFPHKDNVLEGGMTKEEIGKKEIYYHNVIAKEEIDRLLSPKALTNMKKYSINDSQDVTHINDTDNLIIKGNNLIALHTIRERFTKRVKLIYIDPPFNTGGDSFKYNDRFNHSTWLTFMKNRLEIARELLTEDGNIVIHLDWNESHYLKVLADEIFGSENFLNEIIWSYEKCTGASNNLQKNHDTLLVYSKKKGNHFFKTIKALTENLKQKYEKGYLLGGGGGSEGLVVYDRENPKVKKMIDSGKYKVVYAEAKGKPLSDVWYIPFINPVSHERTGFNSQKPEKLLHRLIDVFSNPGDIILDFHMGSGTTQAVDHKMNRQYIGIEQMNYIDDISIPRLQKVIEGEQGGISKDIQWQGGGSFVYAELHSLNK